MTILFTPAHLSVPMSLPCLRQSVQIYVNPNSGYSAHVAKSTVQTLRVVLLLALLEALNRLENVL